MQTKESMATIFNVFTVLTIYRDKRQLVPRYDMQLDKHVHATSTATVPLFVHVSVVKLSSRSKIGVQREHVLGSQVPYSGIVVHRRW